MSKKYLVGYCWDCAKDTKQEVIECCDSKTWRAFEAVATLGFSALTFRDHECECTICGHINTVRKEF